MVPHPPELCRELQHPSRSSTPTVPAPARRVVRPFRQAIPQPSSQPSEYLEQAKEVCAKQKSQEVVTMFGSIGGRHLDEHTGQFLCMDLVFMYELLTSGFQIHPEETVHLVRQVDFDGEPVEVTWTLGAAINTLSSMA